MEYGTCRIQNDLRLEPKDGSESLCNAELLMELRDVAVAVVSPQQKICRLPVRHLAHCGGILRAVGYLSEYIFCGTAMNLYWSSAEGVHSE